MPVNLLVVIPVIIHVFLQHFLVCTNLCFFFQNLTKHSANELLYIETVKRDLSTHLLESAFPEQTTIDYVQVNSITDYLLDLQTAVSPVFPHQRFVDFLMFLF